MLWLNRNEMQISRAWPWASYQIRKIAGCACAGNAGNVFPCRRFQRKPLVSDPGMHHGTCVTHVPWCMSGSLTCGDRENVPGIPGACAPRGGVLPMWWVIHMCRGFDPLFSLWQDRARSFWGIFSHPPTPKRSFGVLKLPILTEFDLLGPKFHFSLDLFGSNFQRPAAHPHHFSDRVPPPPRDAHPQFYVSGKRPM